MDISFVIPNYKSEHYLANCLASLKKHVGNLYYEVIIVNNDPAPLKNDLSADNIRIFNNKTNAGFAQACNKGAAIAQGKTLFFLNPDTVIKSGSISQLLSALDGNTVGAVAPQLILPSGKIQPWSAGCATSLWDIIKNNIGIIKSRKIWNSEKTVEADWISGAAFAIKKDFFAELRGFDEKFFMYFEDADLCKRIAQRGKKILLISSFKVLHLGGQSASDTNQQKQQYYTSQDYYFQKHFGARQLFFLQALRSFSSFFPKILSEKNLNYFFLAFCAFLPFQFALNPTPGFDLAIVRVIIPLMFLGWIFLKLKNKEKFFSPHKLTWLLLSFLLLAIFSVSFSENILWSLRKLFFLLTFFPLYFVAESFLSDARKIRLVISSLVIGASVLALIACLQFLSQFIFGIDTVYAFLAKHVTPFFLGHSFSASVLTYPSWLVNAGGTTYMRAFAIFPDPHMLSYYLGLLIPWSVALWATAKTRKAWLFVAMLSLVLADVLTFTRGGYIALIAGSLVILPLVSRKNVLKILIGASLLFFLFTIAPHSPVAGRLASSFDVQEGSNQARLSNWDQAISIISSHPFGVGIGAYSLAVNPNATYREPIYAHDAYLDVAAELGIPAALVFIAILFLAFRSFWRASKTEPLFVAGVSSITIFTIHNLVENPLYSVHVLPLFLIILALSGSHYIYAKKVSDIK